MPRRGSDKCRDVICPDNKVCNPRTGRCVKTDGRIGREIQQQQPSPRRNPPRQARPRQPSPRRSPQRNNRCGDVVCPANKVCNPSSGRCVKTDGRIGRGIQQQPSPRRNPSPRRDRVKYMVPIPNSEKLKTVKIKIPKTVYDVVEMEEIEIKKFLKDDDNIIFVYKNQAKGGYISQLKNGMKTKAPFVYNCSKETRVPDINIVEINKPYFRLNFDVVFIIPVSQIKYVIESGEKIFLIEDDKRLNLTAGYKSIMNPNNTMYDFDGEMLNIVSRDHCQIGTDKQTHRLKIVHN